jgi:hypothetical protein
MTKTKATRREVVQAMDADGGAMWSAWTDCDDDDSAAAWAWIRCTDGFDDALLMGDRVYVRQPDGTRVRVTA